MNKKSTVGAAVAVAVLAYGGATWYTGEQARKSYEDTVQEVKKFLGPQAVLSHQYKRGFWVSDAQMVLQWSPPEIEATDGVPPLKPVRVVVNSTVRHGPLAGARVAAAVVETRFSAEGMDDIVRGLLARTSAPTLTTVHHLTGGGDLTFSLPAGEVRMEGGAMARWQAMTHQMNFNADRSQVSGTVDWPELSLSSIPAQASGADDSDDGEEEEVEEVEEGQERGGPDTARPGAVNLTTLTLKGASGDFNVQLQDGLWMIGPGKVNGRIDQFAMTSVKGQTPAQSVFSLQDLVYNTVLERTGETLGWTTKAQSKGRLGSLVFDALGLEENASRIDVEVLKRAQQAMVAFYRVDPGQAEKVVASQWQATMLEVAPRFVAALPAYNMKMSGTLEGQQGEMEYGARIDQAPSADEVRLGGWAPALLRGSVVHANLRLPKAWLLRMAQTADEPAVPGNQIDGWVGMAKAQGFVLEEGDFLVSAVQFKGDKLQLNGKEMKLPRMPR